MRRESWSIGGACLLGAFIGTLAALDISTRFQYGSYFWMIVALLGGIVAYVAIDFRQFCAGIARSYHETIAWRPYRLWWRALGSAYVASAAMVPTILTGGMAIVFGLMTGYTWLGVFVYAPLAIIACSLPALLFVGTMSGLVQISRFDETPEMWERRLHRAIESNWDIARNVNPIAVAIFLARYLIIGGAYVLLGLRYGVVHSPEAAVTVASELKAAGKTFAMFIARVFIYVHSSRRTLCFVDATIGAAIGYSFGNAIIGAIAGAILGVINYEMISVRWLKLVPATRS